MRAAWVFFALVALAGPAAAEDEAGKAGKASKASKAGKAKPKAGGATLPVEFSSGSYRAEPQARLTDAGKALTPLRAARRACLQRHASAMDIGEILTFVRFDAKGKAIDVRVAGDLDAAGITCMKKVMAKAKLPAVKGAGETAVAYVDRYELALFLVSSDEEPPAYTAKIEIDESASELAEDSAPGVRAAVEAHAPALARCGGDGGLLDRREQRVVAAVIAFSPTGEPTAVTMEEEKLDEVGRCLQELYPRVRFPKPWDERPQRVRVVVTLTPKAR